MTTAPAFPVSPDLVQLFDRRARLLADLEEQAGRMLPGRVLRQCGKRLGLLAGELNLPRAVLETMALRDYALYTYRAERDSYAERFVAEHYPKVGPEKRQVLDAMAQQRYSLYVIEATHVEQGVLVRDALMQEQLAVIRPALATLGSGATVAMRLLPFAEGWLATEAVVPAPAEAVAQLAKLARDYRAQELKGEPESQRLDPAMEATIATGMFRAAVQSGFFERLSEVMAEKLGGQG
jgi:hypothetical protein